MEGIYARNFDFKIKMGGNFSVVNIKVLDFCKNNTQMCDFVWNCVIIKDFEWNNSIMGGPKGIFLWKKVPKLKAI